MTKESVASLEKWYLKGQYVPQLGTSQFAKFAAHGHSLMVGVNPNTTRYIVDAKSPTAYYDRETNTVAIPGWYFLPEAISEFANTPATSHIALCLINGSTIHEALHSKYTGFTMETAINYVARFVAWADSRLINTIVNLVEDLYIEGRKSISKPQQAWLSAKNTLLFGNARINKDIENFDPSDYMTIVNLLMDYKRKDARDIIDPLFSAELHEALRELFRLSSSSAGSDRLDIAVRIIKLLVDDKGASDKTSDDIVGMDKDSDGEGGSGEGEGETEGKPEAKKFTIKRGMPTAKSPESEFLLTVIGKHGEDKLEGAFDPKEIEEIESIIESIIEESASELAKIVKTFNAEASKEANEYSESTTTSKKAGQIEELSKHLQTVEVSQVATYEIPLVKIELSNRFANLLKQMRTVLPQRGSGKLHGGKIDALRLHQVAIDNKVFSRKTIDETGTNDRVELIILVDASGSMTQPASGARSLFHKSISVTYKIFKALQSTDIVTKVFAHTSTMGINYPQLIKVADSTTKNPLHKFELAASINLRENLDGVIINELLAKHFSSDSRTAKVLLVLSDGSPQSPNYTFGIGTPHTQSVVEKGRKSGVKIYSLSLTEGTIRGNNNIYGKEYNLDASKDLDKVMVQLVTNLVRRK